MPGALAGIRVVEMGFWVAGPGAAGVMADWGADVIKIEPPDGDPFRGMFMNAAGLDVPFNPPFELDNRGKRSIGLNLQRAEGRAITNRLLKGADVFVSNLRQPALRKVGLSYEELRQLNPRLVYCHVSGYGLVGDDCDRPALLDDPRFRDIKVRRENAPVLVPILDAIFATKPFHEWTTIFDRENVWWAPVQTPDEVANDPQVRAAGGIIKVPVTDGEAE